MPHDLAAELGGYRNERVAAQRAARPDRVEAIDAEIERLTAALTGKAEALETSAAALADSGQDGNAALLRAQAAELRAVLGDAGRGGSVETAEDAAPRERAVIKKGAK